MPDAVNLGIWTIGVDVGGTKVAAGFVNAQGEIAQHTRTAMNPRGTAEEGLAAVTTAIDTLLKMATAYAAGGMPAADAPSGVLVGVSPVSVPVTKNATVPLTKAPGRAT